MEQSIPAYLVYVLAFYTLSVVTVFCVMVLPKQYSTIKQKIYDNPLGNRYMTDRVFRTNIRAMVSTRTTSMFCCLRTIPISTGFWLKPRSCLCF